jgi:hypothetical protein
MKKILKLAIIFCFIYWSGCIEPIYIKFDNQKSKNSIFPPDSIIIFSEFLFDNSSKWRYPLTSEIYLTDKYSHTGKTSIFCKLDHTLSSSAGISFYPIDCTPFRNTGILHFYIKAKYANQSFTIELRDGKTDGKDVGVAVVPKNKTSTNWQKISIPLGEFGNIGSYYNKKKGINELAVFNWADVTGIAILTKPMLKPFVIYIDDIYIETKPELPDDLRIKLKKLARLRKIKAKENYIFDDNFISKSFITTFLMRQNWI